MVTLTDLDKKHCLHAYDGAGRFEATCATSPALVRHASDRSEQCVVVTPPRFRGSCSTTKSLCHRANRAFHESGDSPSVLQDATRFPFPLSHEVRHALGQAARS